MELMHIFVITFFMVSVTSHAPTSPSNDLDKNGRQEKKQLKDTVEEELSKEIQDFVKNSQKLEAEQSTRQHSSKDLDLSKLTKDKKYYFRFDVCYFPVNICQILWKARNITKALDAERASKAKPVEGKRRVFASNVRPVTKITRASAVTKAEADDKVVGIAATEAAKEINPPISLGNPSGLFGQFFDDWSDTVKTTRDPKGLRGQVLDLADMHSDLFTEEIQDFVKNSQRLGAEQSTRQHSSKDLDLSKLTKDKKYFFLNMQCMMLIYPNPCSPEFRQLMIQRKAKPVEGERRVFASAVRPVTKATRASATTKAEADDKVVGIAATKAAKEIIPSISLSNPSGLLGQFFDDLSDTVKTTRDPKGLRDQVLDLADMHSDLFTEGAKEN